MGSLWCPGGRDVKQKPSHSQSRKRETPVTQSHRHREGAPQGGHTPARPTKPCCLHKCPHS